MEGHRRLAAAVEAAQPNQSYTIPCASDFRDAVLALAARRGVNVADLARSVALVVPAETLAQFPDPGEPGPDDRGAVVSKSGPAAGGPWRRSARPGGGG
ncbi:MAG: J domain-containing protein, partial [Rhodospirillaceae bacterium]